MFVVPLDLTCLPSTEPESAAAMADGRFEDAVFCDCVVMVLGDSGATADPLSAVFPEVKVPMMLVLVVPTSPECIRLDPLRIVAPLVVVVPLLATFVELLSWRPIAAFQPRFRVPRPPLRLGLSTPKPGTEEVDGDLPGRGGCPGFIVPLCHESELLRTPEWTALDGLEAWC